MRDSKDTLLSMVRNGGQLTTGQQIRLTMLLSIPAILAQFSSVMMQYIDASMVGNLGANPSASIGLVASSTWIFGGFV
ncbi:MAG: MATE family efflux transporter, partial [Bacteroidales bacterium]|nr:MATE family efflux transporter [Bacteroidales bacterium]